MQIRHVIFCRRIAANIAKPATVRCEERKSVLSDKFKMLKMKKIGRDQGMILTMLWCSHIAIPLISRNVAFRFLRQPSAPKPPRPVAKRGSVARIVVATSGARPQKLVLAAQ